MKRYHRTVTFRLTKLDEPGEDELRSKLGEVGLHLERVRVDARDVIADISLDAASPEEADDRALAAARFVPAWRVVVTRVDHPSESWWLERQRASAVNGGASLSSPIQARLAS